MVSLLLALQHAADTMTYTIPNQTQAAIGLAFSIRARRLWCVRRFPQLVALLQIQPEISRIPEYGGQHQCCASRDCTAIGTQLIHGFSTDAHRFSQLSLSQRHGHEEFLGNHFTDTDALSFCDIHSLPHDFPLLPLHGKQAIFTFYIQWHIFPLIGNTMKNTMLRNSCLLFVKR